MDDSLSRRDFVAYAGVGAGLILGGVPVWADAKRPRRKATPFARGGSFPQGVAAGEPAPDGISLWTRLDGAYRTPQKLTLEISPDSDFRRTAYRRTVVAKPDRDLTILTRIERKKWMKPGERYHYRFRTKEVESDRGRFTLLNPGGSKEPVKVVFFSCQDWQAGYYNAHRAIAAEDADVVIGLGDYIYERNFYEGPRKDTLGANGDGEVQTLAEYRDKYRMYKADEDLRAMHAAHNYIGIPDDHEVEDNYARDLPGEATKNVRVPFLDRREAGYRSFLEYMPFRRSAGPGHLFYRSLSLGGSADLFLLDQRRYRDDQPCGDSITTPCPEAETTPRVFLGREQMNWLKEGLSSSAASWKLIGQQLMIMALDTPQGLPLNKDSWDGYGVERRELTTHLKGIKDVAFMTGDIHTFFAGEVGPNGRGSESVATEFVGGSITSLGLPESIKEMAGGGLSGDQVRLITENLLLVNPHLKFQDQKSRGYGVLTASDTELRVELKGVDAIKKGATKATTLGGFRVRRGSARVERV